MKKLTAVFTLLTLVLTLSSCGNKAFERGEIKENGYKSEFFGIEINLSEEWKISSKEEIDKYNESQTALMFDFAASSSNGTSLHVNYHKKMTKNAKQLATDQVKSISESFKAANFTVKTAETGKIKLAGKKRHTAFVVGENKGLVYTQRIVFIEKGDYIAYVNITGIKAEEIEEAVSSVKKIK